MAEVFIIDGMTQDEVEGQLAKCRESIRVVNTFMPHNGTLYFDYDSRESCTGPRVPSGSQSILNFVPNYEI